MHTHDVLLNVSGFDVVNPLLLSAVVSRCPNVFVCAGDPFSPRPTDSPIFFSYNEGGVWAKRGLSEWVCVVCSNCMFECCCLFIFNICSERKDVFVGKVLVFFIVLAVSNTL